MWKLCYAFERRNQHEEIRWSCSILITTETIQEYFTDDHRTRILTHTGCRVIEKAYKNGDYDKEVRFYANHSEDCKCGYK